MKTTELPSQLRITAIATSALILLSASAGAGTLDGSNGVDMSGTGMVSNAPLITYGSQFDYGWDQPLMQGFVVSAAQLTGLTVDNTAVDSLDLLPVQLQSAAIIDSSGSAVVAMTAGATPGSPGVVSFLTLQPAPLMPHLAQTHWGISRSPVPPS